jgi:hypothetical protein
LHDAHAAHDAGVKWAPTCVGDWQRIKFEEHEVSHHIKGRLQCFTAVLGLGILSLQSTCAVAHDHDENSRRVKRIQGIVVTGTNSAFGKPLFSWGGPYGTFNFPTTFVYNKNGTEPLPLDENTPPSAILATGVSPEYLFIRGETPDVVKPEWINVPLRKVPVNIDFDPSLQQKTVLRGLLEAQPAERAQSEPAGDITVGQWKNASGVLTINCATGRGAELKMRMQNLIPNRLYSIWATMGLPKPGGGIQNPTLPWPVGGTPSVLMTDDHGDATFKRWIKFCPLDKNATPDPMLTIELLYHANHSIYGAIPAPGIMLGLITFPHILFPINVEMLEN